MKKISRSPFFNKRLFPILFGAFLLGLGALIVSGLATPQARDVPPPPPVILIPFGLAFAAILIVWRKLFSRLADEVWDCGDYLWVKTDGHDLRIPLASIINVNSNLMVNPSVIVLRLREPGPLGRDIAFLPIVGKPWRLWQAFKLSSPLIDVLIDRIDAARQQGKGH